MSDHNNNHLAKASSALSEAPRLPRAVERNSLAALLYPSIMTTGPASSRPPLSSNVQGQGRRLPRDLAGILGDVLDLLDEDDIFDTFETPTRAAKDDKTSSERRQ